MRTIVPDSNGLPDNSGDGCDPVRVTTKNSAPLREADYFYNLQETWSDAARAAAAAARKARKQNKGLIGRGVTIASYDPHAVRSQKKALFQGALRRGRLAYFMAKGYDATGAQKMVASRVRKGPRSLVVSATGKRRHGYSTR